MKFISKSTNLMVVLKPGMPGNAALGTTATPGIYARFQNGVLEVKEQSISDLLLKSPSFNVDFIAAEDEAADPYAYLRSENEPNHTITEINYGHAEKAVSTKNTKPMDPKIRALLQEESKKMAMEMMKEMLPGMVQEGVKEVLSQMSSTTKAEEGSAKDPVADDSAKKSSGKAKKGTNDIISEETETPAV